MRANHPVLTADTAENRIIRQALHQMDRMWVSFVVTLAFVVASSPSLALERPNSFADLAERLLPSVVNISTAQVERGDEQVQRFQAPPGSPFEDMFREFFERNRPDNQAPRATSLGSGFIIDPSGYVVTNNHVIGEADEITVILQDDTEYAAVLVGVDAKTDLALLKIEPESPLPAVQFGDSEVMRVGDWVIAIGNPFGLGGSVTTGIISARSRNINAGPYDNFIQTDASINRGNSGGPLFNLAGQVIGINTAIFSPSGGSVGIGFATPSSIAQKVLTQIREFGRTKRGWLGVRIQTVTDDIAENVGLGDTRGALVAGVQEGSPAKAARFEAGDVIRVFDGKDISEMRTLPRVVAETEIGRKVEVEVWRQGRNEILQVVIGELKEDEQVAAVPSQIPREATVGAVDELGLILAAITPELRAEYNLGQETAGVLVTQVIGGSPASEKDIRPGDIIVEVSQTEVGSPALVQNKVIEARNAGRRSVLLLVQRDEDLRFVALRITPG